MAWLHRKLPDIWGRLYVLSCHRLARHPSLDPHNGYWLVFLSVAIRLFYERLAQLRRGGPGLVPAWPRYGRGSFKASMEIGFDGLGQQHSGGSPFQAVRPVSFVSMEIATGRFPMEFITRTS